MISSRASRFLILFVIVLSGIALAAGQQAGVAGPFTAEQAVGGRAAYQLHCASCHRPDLRGSGEAAPLSGTNFMTTWADRSARDLYERIHGSMPPGAAGTLGEATYVSIVAYILQANGAPAGPQPLTAAAAQRIGSVATGQAPAQAAGQPRSAGRRPRTRRPALSSGRSDCRRASEELRPGHRRDAEESGSGRLADGRGATIRRGATARSSQVTTDNVKQSQSRLGVGDERRRDAISRRRSCTTASCTWCNPGTSCRRSTPAPAT